MRYQEVELPSHIGKKFFVKDLDSYGYKNIQLKNIDTIDQKSKRHERMALLASKCIADTIVLTNTGRKYVTLQRFSMNSSHDNIINNLELGLHAILNSKHEY